MKIKSMVQGAGRFSLILFAAALLIFSCKLTQEDEFRNTLSFTEYYDSLAQFDSAKIEVKAFDGRLLDVVYYGRVDSLAEIENLPVPNWKGERIIISITGIKGGKPVYQVEKGFDGSSNRIISSHPLLDPNASLSSTESQIQMVLGESVTLPEVTVLPVDLINKSLAWSTASPGIVNIVDGSLKAIKPGSVKLTAKLQVDTAKTLSFSISVVADPMVPDRLDIIGDTLKLAEQGAPGSFQVQLYPSTATQNPVAWRIQDSTVAESSADGSFLGLKKGLTKVWAASVGNPAALDSAYVLVSGPVPVEIVRFTVDSVEIFIGGAEEPLTVEVIPTQASKAVTYTVVDRSIVEMTSSGMKGKAVGTTKVHVRSNQNIDKNDSLIVKVSMPVTVERVEISPRSIVLYAGGASQVLDAKVYPATAPQSVKWSTSNDSIARANDLGRVDPVDTGKVWISALSRTDTLKVDKIEVWVKRDAPVVTLGKDTIISTGQTANFLPAVSQAYGTVVLVKWDLDEDNSWEDSSIQVALVSKKYDANGEYIAKFLVRDSEGNETVASKRVTVVKGLNVQIHKPKNNSYTNQTHIDVEWSIDGKTQDSLTKQSLTEGINTFSRSSRDGAGTVVTATVTVILDTLAPKAPKITGTSPTNTQPKWTWSTGGDGIGDFRFQLGNGAFLPTAPTSRDTEFVLSATPTAGTTYTLFVQEKDQAGNWSPSAFLAIKYDNTKPVVTFVSPQASGTFYTKAVTMAISGTATGPNPIVQVNYRINAGTVAAATLALGGAWSIANVPLTDGTPVSIQVIAVDSVGNTGDASLSILRDNGLPTAPIFTASPQATVRSAVGSWTWTAGSDGTEGSGLNGRFRHNLNGGAWSETNGTTVTDLILIEGNNTFSVQEQDRALNWSPSATSNVKVDTRGPVVAITSPTTTGGNYTDTGKIVVSIGGTVSDSGIGVKEVSCDLAGATTGNFNATLSGANWSIAPTFKSGTTTVRCTGVDNFDKPGTSASVSITIALPLPKISNLDVPTGMVLNKNSFSVSYDVTVNGVVTRESSPVALSEGSNKISLISIATNLVGEKGGLQVTYVLRSKVVFANKDATGKADGTSWMDAYTKIDDAVKSPIFSAGGAQLWISHGEYGSTSTPTSIAFPASGRILGGFDAASLPSDTTASFRNLITNRTQLTEFYFTMETLGGRVEFNGLELRDGYLQARLISATLNGNEAIAYVNCLITKKYRRLYEYEVSSDIKVLVEMIGCTVGGDFPDGDGPNQFSLQFLSPGVFVARNTRFIRNKQTNTRGPILYITQGQNLSQRVDFEDCELNTFVNTTQGDYFILESGNANSTINITRSSVLGGTDLIRTDGTLHYDASNTTIPFVPFPSE